VSPPLQVVCLDAAGTLMEERAGRAGLYAQVLATFGVLADEADVARWMAAAHDGVLADQPDLRPYGAPWFRLFVKQVLASAGSDADPETVRVQLAERFTDPSSYRVFPDVLPTLRRLRGAGLGLALVSNWSDRLPPLLEDLGLAEWFDVLAVSQTVGAEKPDPALFLHALGALGVAPERAVHVGDRWENDVLGARAAGLTAWFLDRDGARPVGPDVVRSLTEAADRVLP
jgi:putative hydrolase of the HAD superfamily